MNHSSSNSDNYEKTFLEYTNNSNEKALLANRVISLASKHKSCLDLGAGNGALTSVLATGFEKIIAVDNKPAHIEALSQIANCTAVLSNIEDFKSTETFDMILLSYSVTGINPTRLNETLRNYLKLRTLGAGKLLAITFEDGCAWDLFSTEVYSVLNIKRTGGKNNHLKMFDAAGLNCTPVSSDISQIESDNLENLAANLAFFFGHKKAEYLSRLKEFSKLLQKYVQLTSSGGVSLSAEHSFIELS